MGSAARKDECWFEPYFSKHAGCQMNCRRISRNDVAIVMSYGRSYHVRGAIIYALGHREAETCRKEGLNLDRVEGLQVVCALQDDSVITAYRNHDLSSLRRRNTRWAPGQ